jgi:hypothetical protein
MNTTYTVKHIQKGLALFIIVVLMSTNASIRAKEGAIRAIDIYSNQKERALLVHTALYDSNYIVRQRRC